MFDENAIKKQVLEEIAQFLDGKLGESLKTDGPKVLDVSLAAKGEPDGDEPEAPDLPDAPEGDGPVDDEDAKKLLELARLGKGR